jgi:hypothetical protein
MLPSRVVKCEMNLFCFRYVDARVAALARQSAMSLCIQCLNTDQYSDHKLQQMALQAPRMMEGEADDIVRDTGL